MRPPRTPRHRATAVSWSPGCGGWRISRSEVLQQNQVLGIAAVGDGQAILSRIGRNKQLVLGHLAIPDESGSLDLMFAEGAVTLYHDQAIRSRIRDGDRTARKYG